MKELVRHICLMLLMVCAACVATLQEDMAPDEAAPCDLCTSCLQQKQHPARKTIAHLYAERFATPAAATVQHPHHPSHSSKFKCLTPEAKGGDKARQIFYRISENNLHTTLLHLHAVDYYVYALEHIII